MPSTPMLLPVAPWLTRLQMYGGQSYSVGVWDTAGAERFEAMTRIYFKVWQVAAPCTLVAARDTR